MALRPAPTQGMLSSVTVVGSSVRPAPCFLQPQGAGGIPCLPAGAHRARPHHQHPVLAPVNTVVGLAWDKLRVANC